MIKLSQCLLGDTESILFLVSEKKDELPEPEPEENDGKEKQQNEFVESPESLDDEPPSKIAKASRQSRITETCIKITQIYWITRESMRGSGCGRHVL